jgi:hypothetical protein
MSNLTVANTIKEQIAAGCGVDGSQGFVCMMAWGVDRMVGCGEETEDNRGWLSFTVKGRKFKGAVKIKLMWNDTYRVEFWKTRRPNLKMIEAYDEVYCDMLTDLIDSYVEA